MCSVTVYVTFLKHNPSNLKHTIFTNLKRHRIRIKEVNFNII